MIDVCHIGMSVRLASLTDEQAGWMAHFYLLQISLNELLSLYPADELLGICRRQPRLVCTQNSLLKLLSEESACSGGLHFPWILIKCNGKALLCQLCIFLHT